MSEMAKADAGAEEGNPPELKLTYWQIRGLAAPLRMMLSFADIPFEETRYAWGQAGDWFGTDKPALQGRNALANLPNITDGNTGIGLALCRQLVVEHDCYVYLGSRSVERGRAAIKSIVDAHPDVAPNIELLQIDVADDTSCAAAAGALKEKNVAIYALVNNAGIGLSTDSGDPAAVLNTNLHGAKRVTEAMIDLIDPAQGRVVNVSSGMGPLWLQSQDSETKALFTSPDLGWEELEAAVQAGLGTATRGLGGTSYGLSKAAMNAYTSIQARTYRSLICTSLSPGFIATNMTEGYGAQTTAEQGTVSLIRCIFGDVTSGSYYGSDGVRSPLTVTRDPGTPEYSGATTPFRSLCL